MKKLVIKKCNHCGAMVKVLQDCTCNGCGIKCCDEQMQELEPNSVDAAIEKHVPTYEIVGDKIIVKVNHVMEEEHYIEWVCVVDENKEKTVYFKPGEEAQAKFCYSKGAILYAYCNKHGLWKKEVE